MLPSSSTKHQAPTIRRWRWGRSRRTVVHTGDSSYAGWRATFERYIAEYLIDSELGSWHHELDEHNRPAATTWRGKPDVYHAYQALLLARMPLAPVLSVQLARGQL